MPRKYSSRKLKDKISLFDDLRLGESYTSLILGIIVVIVGSVLLLSVARTKNAEIPQTSSVSTSQAITQVIDTDSERVISSVTSTQIDTETKEQAQDKKIAKSNDVPDQKLESKSEVNKSDIKQGGKYTVQKGDDLWSISTRVYKSGYNWVDIARANKLPNSDIIEVGMKLDIPKIEQKIVTTEAKEKVVSVDEQRVEKAKRITGNKYTVKKGDYLWGIAVRAYGDGYKWTEIAQVNKIENPDIIYVDHNLNLPRK